MPPLYTEPQLPPCEGQVFSACSWYQGGRHTHTVKSENFCEAWITLELGSINP